MRTLIRVVRGLLALGMLVAVVGGVPWFLAASLGVPFPRPMPTSLNQVGPWLAIWRINRARFVLDLLGIVGWGYWVAFIRQLAVQVPGAVADAVAIARHCAPAVRDRRTGPAASLVAALLAAVAMSIVMSRTPAAAKVSAPAPAKATVSVTTPAVPAARATATTAATIYTVIDGDTLWDIAAHHLGDAQRWHEIYDLNSTRVQADGQRMSDPNMILPGWTFELPEDRSAAKAPETPVSVHPPGSDAASLPIAVPQPATETASSASSAQSGSATQTDHVVARSSSPTAHRDRSSVDLPGGGVVGIGLAGTLAAAIALARKRRRIRTTARWPIPLDTDRPVVPDSVAAIERAHLATLAPPALGYFQDGDLDPEDDDPYLSGLDGVEGADDIETPGPAIATSGTSVRSGLHGPSIPASYSEFTTTGSLAFGIVGGREVGLNLRAHAGFGLTGSGALDTARALLVGVLANGGPLASLDHMRVLIPSPDLTALFGDRPPPVPRLEVAADLDEAVDALEAEYLERRRTVADLGVRDAAEVRRFYAEQTLEPLVLIASPESSTAPQLAALLDVGRTVDLHAILLGPWESGVTAEIGADGYTHCSDQHLDGVRAFVLSDSGAMALLDQLGPELTARNEDTTDEPPVEETTPNLAAVPTQQPAVTTLPLVPRVVVNVLGPVTVTVDNHEVVLNNKETSILTFLALHPAGIARDEIIAALWTNPDGTNNGSPETFRSTVYHARTRIRTATGEAKKMYITNRGTRYLLDPADIATDLSRFTEHLDTANRTRDETERIASLEAAVDNYRGHLAAGIHADWLIVDREAESRRFSDACARLADLTIDTRPEFALHVLERAVADADCNQELYAKIMKVQARLGRYAEMWKTLRLLEVRLAALDDEPDRDVYELADRLTDQHAHRAV